MKIKEFCFFAGLLSFVSVSAAFSEETEKPTGTVPSGTQLAVMVRTADVAGIGVMEYVQGSNGGKIEVTVSDYWTGNPGTNVIHLNQWNYHRGRSLATNTPVVFFAMAWENIRPTNVTTRTPKTSYNYVPLFTNVNETVGLHLFGGDRAWFRVGRDNGLMYEYVTNLWDCVRVNPDLDTYYDVLRNGSNVSEEDSWRTRWDSRTSLRNLFGELPEQKLVQILEDPLLNERTKERVEVALKNRFGWWWDDNWIIQPPPKP